jgi:hypothetical protein
MSARWLAAVSLAVLFVPSFSAIAADPPPADLPPPREVPSAIVPPPVVYRQNRYEVWQYYDVNRQGYWVPRVVYSPYGSYYMENGQPYFWATIHSTYWRPTIQGTPYRSPE